MSQPYTVAPPTYEDARPARKANYGSAATSDPLDEEAGFPEADDWKVSQSSQEIRHAFIRKVYATLFLQILGSVAFGIALRTDAARAWVLTNQWSLWVSLAGTFISLFACQWKAQVYPTNYILLSIFTLFESYMIGSAVSFYKQEIVLQALVATLFVFVGLTLFTLQSKYDFSSLGPWLFTAIFAVLGVSLINFFIPFGRVEDAVFAGIVVLIFCGFVLYDTHALMNRLSPDECAVLLQFMGHELTAHGHILASISLYLDVVNLFLWILRLLNDIQRD